jgi:MYXO-CTERM domain-containing protein
MSAQALIERDTIRHPWEGHMKQIIMAMLLVSVCLCSPGPAGAELPSRDFWPSSDLWKDAGPPPDLYSFKEGGFICDVYFPDYQPKPDKYAVPDYVKPDTLTPPSPDGGALPDMPRGNKDAGPSSDGGAQEDELDGGCSVAAHTSQPLPVAFLFGLLLLLQRRRR